MVKWHHSPFAAVQWVHSLRERPRVRFLLVPFFIFFLIVTCYLRVVLLRRDLTLGSIFRFSSLEASLSTLTHTHIPPPKLSFLPRKGT